MYLILNGPMLAHGRQQIRGCGLFRSATGDADHDLVSDFAGFDHRRGPLSWEHLLYRGKVDVTVQDCAGSQDAMLNAPVVFVPGFCRRGKNPRA